MKLNQLDRFIQHTARQAGQAIAQRYGKVTTGQQKTSQHDIVTEADYAAERIIISAIRQKFPYHNILSEEAGVLQGRNSPYTWIIDPLDGTANFASGVPLFAVIIALAKGDHIINGVMFDPIHNEMFYSRAGQGSYCNGKRIYVSKQTDLSYMIVKISNVRGRSSLEQFAHWRGLIALHTTYYKAFGSAAHALMALAAGRIDLYIIGGAYPWDIAAGALLVREAGGMITRTDGRPWSWQDNNQHLIAANPRLHRKVRALLNQ